MSPTQKYENLFSSYFSKTFKVDEETGRPNRRGLVDIMRVDRRENKRALIVLFDFDSLALIKRRFGQKIFKEFLDQLENHVSTVLDEDFILARSGKTSFAVYVQDFNQTHMNGLLKQLSSFRPVFRTAQISTRIICVSERQDKYERPSFTLFKALKKLRQIKRLKNDVYASLSQEAPFIQDNYAEPAAHAVNECERAI
ncbi:MAG: diguanylate cyclase domain-containing protein [Alphaproteobacteria bacterium]